MMLGDNGNIKEVLGIASFISYLTIYLIYHCIVVFCLYSEIALYNNTELRQGRKNAVVVVRNSTAYTQALHKKTPVARAIVANPVPGLPMESQLQEGEMSPRILTPPN